MKRSGLQKRKEYVRLLKSLEKLQSLSENKLMRMADCLEEATFNKGDYIIRQGDSGDTFYIIQHGKVKVTHKEVGRYTILSSSESFKIKILYFLTLWCRLGATMCAPTLWPRSPSSKHLKSVIAQILMEKSCLFVINFLSGCLTQKLSQVLLIFFSLLHCLIRSLIFVML